MEWSQWVFFCVTTLVSAGVGYATHTWRSRHERRAKLLVILDGLAVGRLDEIRVAVVEAYRKKVALVEQRSGSRWEAARQVSLARTAMTAVAYRHLKGTRYRGLLECIVRQLDDVLANPRANLATVEELVEQITNTLTWLASEPQY